MKTVLFPVETKGSRSCSGTIKNGSLPYGIPWCGATMIQDFDLTARWSTLLHAHFTEDVHNIAQLWPDVQSLEVSYRTIEGFDPTFAQSILEQPDLHDDASNRALRNSLLTLVMEPSIRGYVLSISPAIKYARSHNFAPMILV